MKRLILFAATVFLVGAVNAQSLKLQSAISDLKNKRLDRAKENVDATSVHENTKDDAKTWRYKAEVYYELAVTTNEKYKALVANEDPLQVASEAVLKSSELDKSAEFKEINCIIMQKVAVEYFNRGIVKFEAKDYQTALNLFEKSIQANINAGKFGIQNHAGNITANTNNGRYFAGVSADLVNDTTLMMTNFQALVNSGFKDIHPYSTLYNAYKSKNDTVKAKRIAERVVKVLDTNYNAYIILADYQAYVGDNEGFKSTLQKVLTMKPNDILVLNAIAVAYEQNKEYDLALEKYNQSLQINPKQFEANYQIGVLHFNHGVDIFNQANKVPEDDNTGLYEKYNNEGKGLFMKAIPYFEKAHDIKPKDENTVRALISLNSRLENFEAVKKWKDILSTLE